MVCTWFFSRFNSWSCSHSLPERSALDCAICQSIPVHLLIGTEGGQSNFAPKSKNGDIQDWYTIYTQK